MTRSMVRATGMPLNESSLEIIPKKRKLNSTKSERPAKRIKSTLSLDESQKKESLPQQPSGLSNSITNEQIVESTPQIPIEESPQIEVEESSQIAKEQTSQVLIEETPQIEDEESPQIANEQSPVLVNFHYPVPEDNENGNNEKSSTALSQIDYRIGEVVWAKIKRYPHWPAKIKGFPSTRTVEVVWFNDYRTTKVYKSQLFKFLIHFEEFAKKFDDTVGLKTAAQEGLIYYGNMMHK